ncbi:transglutaminase domain-containing protein [Candidatus Woesearchaeota archaeon]|nr:transglutaminase domain-containing protein [Candidatus Woesearchaeota archaeon]
MNINLDRNKKIVLVAVIILLISLFYYNLSFNITGRVIDPIGAKDICLKESNNKYNTCIEPCSISFPLGWFYLPDCKASCVNEKNIRDNQCQIEYESLAPICGNNVCETIVSENAENCALDCKAKEGLCVGCLLNDVCVDFGFRSKINNLDSYCSISNVFKVQGGEGETCDNNFECKDDFCSYGKCFNLYGKIEKTVAESEKVAKKLEKRLSKGCGNEICEDAETCISCESDCGKCIYGVAGSNDDAVCGFGWSVTKKKIKFWGATVSSSKKYNQWINAKDGNIKVSNPENPMKTKINEWVYSNPNLYQETKNKMYDKSVNKIFNEVLKIFGGGGLGSINYEMTSCPYLTGSAPTPSHELLKGGKGNCVDWSALLVSLLRTMDVPSERIFMIDYPTTSMGWNPGHSVAVYISDSGKQWIMDITCAMGIFNNLNELGGCSCQGGDAFYHWGNDQTYGWGLNGVGC